MLIASGVAKVVEPKPVERALNGLGLSLRPGFGRVVGLVELILGGLGLFSKSTVSAVGVGLIYCAFVAVVLAARKAGLKDCGCIGVRRSEPKLTHAILNAVSAAVAFSVAAAGPSAMGTELAALAWTTSIAVAAGVLVLAAGVLLLNADA